MLLSGLPCGKTASPGGVKQPDPRRCAPRGCFPPDPPFPPTPPSPSTIGALRWFVVLQPILAGLGIYAFLRGERVSRPAATAGGLVLAMAMADSYISLSIPFAGSLAWTALTLAAASRLMRARSWPARLGWLLVTAAAWGQLAGAHMSNGLLMGTAALFVFVVVRLASSARAGEWRGPLAAAGLLVVALLMVNVRVVLRRVPYVDRSGLGMGYLRLKH